MAAVVIEKRYRVTARLAILPDDAQGQVYLEQGTLVPTNVTDEILQHLLDSHIISPVIAPVVLAA